MCQNLRWDRGARSAGQGACGRRHKELTTSWTSQSKRCFEEVRSQAGAWDRDGTGHGGDREEDGTRDGTRHRERVRESPDGAKFGPVTLNWYRGGDFDRIWTASNRDARPSMDVVQTESEICCDPPLLPGQPAKRVVDRESIRKICRRFWQLVECRAAPRDSKVMRPKALHC